MAVARAYDDVQREVVAAQGGRHGEKNRALLDAVQAEAARLRAHQLDIVQAFAKALTR